MPFSNQWSEVAPGIEGRRVGALLVRVFIWEDGKWAYTARCDERNQPKHYHFERGFDDAEAAKNAAVQHSRNARPGSSKGPLRRVTIPHSPHVCSSCLQTGHNRRTCRRAQP